MEEGGRTEGRAERGGGARGSKHDAATRQRLLDAALRLFSARGYHHVTVRDLCREAKANLASVNYHFGGKLELYDEVVSCALDRLRADPIIAAPEGAPAEERIRHYVREYVPRLAAPSGHGIRFQMLMRHEMSEPSPLAPRIAQVIILPRVRYLSEAIAELLGTTPDDPRVARSVVSLQAQCLFLMPNNFRKVALEGVEDPGPEEIAGWVEHITEFTLAGIRRLDQRG